MGHHIVTEVVQEQFVFTKRARTIVGLVFGIGLLMMLAGIFIGSDTGHEDATVGHEQVDASHSGEEEAAAIREAEGTPHGESVESHGAGHDQGGTHTQRIWANLLLAGYYFLLISVGALFFVAVNYAANAGWSTLTKRIQESISSYLPIGALLVLLVIFFGKEQLYDWYNYFYHGGEGDRIMESKSWFLNWKFFLVGVPLIFAVWVFFRYKFRSLSLKEDENGGMEYFRQSVRWSAGFLVFFAFSFSIMSWLVIMSLEAHWFSTIFSVYNFAVAFVTGLTVIMFFTIYLKSRGYLEHVSNEVVHDHGKFMFAFTIFWGYIFLAQWLLIWYANLPEEVVYFNRRLDEPYTNLFYANIIVNFLLPFLVLMMRNAKRHPWVLTVAGLLILGGHWLDTYLMIMPGVMGVNAQIGLLEIGTTMTFAGLFIYLVLNSLSKAPLYAKNHPYILESANHDVGP